MARTRTFIAVEVSAGVRHNAQVLQQTLAQVTPTIKWTHPDTLHLTLLFLGDVEDRNLPEVCEHVQAVTHTFAPFSLHVAGLGAFPDWHHPKILWAGVRQGSEQLRTLHEGIAQRLIPAGLYRPEGRPFTPHLTLGRIPSHATHLSLRRALDKRTDWEAGQTWVDQVIVFASTLERHGPIHTPLFRCPLGAKPTSDAVSPLITPKPLGITNPDQSHQETD
ncbi:MAG: RNA 2',3'-cyclic phosphodiesterase [Thermogemmata sp.]|jgi:2'-5' RNA ligase|uniref:RNA 2',3'-cyclic phosphodiesterase n=1 Tax=Thermogemmata fonticola TaxID=2755323 RepID=A0A7V9AB11_9BACT|nr:RNA 2',3'-cyclic phosphodiesterase [Thermogemmata fonticola]MBA2225459.1 RNA 2',3'-cyclic phosphodiesterase [Thermogemmata fonticola]MCX8138587.1 RNA 2',3'-cyclic phosphodiesterase [Gemmataceae bacterium]